MLDELIDIFDKNNKPLNKTVMKSLAHADGLWHQGAHVWVVNQLGQVLLQMRSKEKELHPSAWDTSAAGHVGAGEDPRTAARRELEEELGIEAKPEDLQFYKIRKQEGGYKHLKNNEFHNIYFYTFDGKIEDLKLQKEEIDAVKFFSLEELAKEYKAHREQFANSPDEIADVLNGLKTFTSINMSKNKIDTYSYRGWLVSDFFFKRLFAVLGYYMLSFLIIYKAILLFMAIIMIAAFCVKLALGTA